MTNDELDAIEARANTAIGATVPMAVLTDDNRRAIEETVRNVPALVAAVRERDAEIARLRFYETIVNKMIEERQREALEGA